MMRPPTERSILTAWNDLGAPATGKGHSAYQVPRTNAWVYKTNAGTFGLLLSGVTPPPGIPDLRYVRFAYRPQKELVVDGRRSRLDGCLEVEALPGCDQATLARVMDRLVQENPNGRFTTQALVRTIHDVIKVVQPNRAPVTKESALGAWGEIYLLRQLVATAADSSEQFALVRAWESQVDVRDIIDFRFARCRIAVEVKTTLSERIHRIQGYAQVTAPQGFEGYLASIRASESLASGAGMTCADLIADIKKHALGDADARKAFADHLDARCEVRGPEASDDAHRFAAANLAIGGYRLDDVPRPTKVDGVLDVHWTADLRGLDALLPEEWARLVGQIGGVITS